MTSFEEKQKNRLIQDSFKMRIQQFLAKALERRYNHVSTKCGSVKGDTMTKAIELNKKILELNNVSEIIKIIKQNEKERTINIVNYVTGFHRVVQLISKNEKGYVKNRKLIDSSIEATINKVIKCLSYKKRFEKANNYNVRLFASFIWSYSKYCSLRYELDVKLKNNGINIINKTKDSNSSRYAKWNTAAKDAREKAEHLFFTNTEFTHFNYHETIMCMIKFYANMYLDYASPSRYVIILWALSKLNKLKMLTTSDNLEKLNIKQNDIFRKYEKKSINMLPQLQSKEIVILAYAYSYTNYANFDWYLQIKNFILEKEKHKELIDDKNYESVSNLLWSLSNRNIFFPDLLQSMVGYMFQKEKCFSFLKGKELLTILFCLCKFPLLFTDKENNKIKGVNKNVMFYELLKKKTLHSIGFLSCSKLKKIIEHQNNKDISLSYKNDKWQKDITHELSKCAFSNHWYHSLYKKNVNGISLENMILLVWSLSLKYIYSANLFLHIFVKLKESINPENRYTVYNSSFHILTNLYLSLLSFILSNEVFINIYFNKEEMEGLHILYDSLPTFTNIFFLLKKSVNINQRTRDVETSFMQKHIFNFIKDIKKIKGTTVLLEYNSPINIFIDILIISKNALFTKWKEKTERKNTSYVIDNNGSKIEKDDSFRGSKNRKKYHSPFISQSLFWSTRPFIFLLDTRTICVMRNVDAHYLCFMANMYKNRFFSCELHSKENQKDHIRKEELFHYIDMLNKFCSYNLEEKEEIMKICNNLYIFLNTHFSYIEERDVVSFFYKYTLFCNKFYKKFSDLHWNVLCKVMSLFFNFAFSFMKKKEYDTYSFFDILWICFRYLKYIDYLYNKVDSIENAKRMEAGKIEKDKDYFNKERKNILCLFEEVKKRIIKRNQKCEHNLMSDISSKNMTLLLSIFFYIENSDDIINSFENNNFNNVQFGMKDILYILNGITKNKKYMHLGEMFCKRFIEYIKFSTKRELVDFTFYCAELKVNELYIKNAILEKLSADLSTNNNDNGNDNDNDNDNKGLSKRDKEKQSGLKDTESISDKSDLSNEIKEKKIIHGRIKFVETLSGEELANLIRNCYRMHCFEKDLFNTFCELSWKKRKEMGLKQLCIILPSFARFYSIHAVETDSNKVKLKDIEEGNKKIKIKFICDPLEEDTNIRNRNFPRVLGKLITYAEHTLDMYNINNCDKEKVKGTDKKEDAGKDKNSHWYFYQLCYFMESITLLKIENKKLYKECIHRTLEIIENFKLDKREKESFEKILGKLLWCLSYYHRMEFLFSFKIIQFLLKNRLYEKSVVADNFTACFLYFVKSRVLNIYFFQKLGEAVMKNISVNSFVEEKGKIWLKANVINELYATMSWAYAFSFVHGNSNEKRDMKDENETGKLREIEYFMFLKDIYNFLLREMINLEKKNCLYFNSLCRYLWGVSIVNSLNANLFHFLNKYNWDRVVISNEKKMHLHMIFTFLLRIKYTDVIPFMSDLFIKFGKKVVSALKNEMASQSCYLKNDIPKEEFLKKNKISHLHYQIITILNELNLQYENEFTAEDFLTVDIKINTTFGEKIAIEVDGPSHYFLLLNDILSSDSATMRKRYVKCGTTHFKNYLLQKNGWKVISIPFFEWNKFSHKGKKNYLIKKLTQVSIHLKNYLE